MARINNGSLLTSPGAPVRPNGPGPRPKGPGGLPPTPGGVTGPTVPQTPTPGGVTGPTVPQTPSPWLPSTPGINPGIDPETGRPIFVPSSTGGTSPPSAGGGGKTGLTADINWIPGKQVSSGPLLPPNVNPSFPAENAPGTSFEAEAARVYGADSPMVRAARIRALEGQQGQGLLFSNLATEAGESAAMRQAMDLVAPDVAYKQDLEKSREGYTQQLGLGSQQFEHQSQINSQMNRYDTATREKMQEYTLQTEQMKNEFVRELDAMNYGQEMQGTLLNTMNSMITTSNGILAQLAMSGEATAAEVAAIQESLKNGLATYTNIWKKSAGSTDIFDFSGIG